MQPRWYQEEAIQSIYNYFMHKGGNPLIALPTASGKSIIPAIFIKRIMQQWPNQRFLLMSHVSILIKQNAEKLLEAWNTAPLGIYSAGLKQKQAALPIVFGGIQSMIKNPVIFGHRDLIFIDEAHLVSQDEASMYLTFISMMKLINPALKVVGLTATPFRMGQGMLTENGLFTDICYNMTDINGFNRLIAEGFLAPLVPLRTKMELDVSSVGMQKYEFIPGQLQSAVDKQEITYAGLREVVEAGQNRRSWLIFSSGIEHAEHIAAMLGSFGIECAPVHSRQRDFGRNEEYNDQAIRAFKDGKLRAVVNFGKLTTGFDNPIIDIIADFNPTMSIVKHIQKYGRGMRIAEGKNDCLALDFARNVPRLGCVNDPIIPHKKGEKQGDIPIKICDSCGAYNHISARICCNCGEEFSFKVKIVAKPGTDAILRSDLPVVETFDVQKVIYAAHNKIGSPQSLKISYFTGMQMFNEWMLLEHGGLMGKKARDLWRQMHKSEPPPTVTEALKFVSELRPPRKIKVWMNKKFPEVLSREF